MTDASPPPFFTRYGFRRTDDLGAALWIEPYPEIVRGGVLLATVLASAVDIVGSLQTREIAGTDATFTTDLSVRAPARFVPERILAKGEPLRVGRSTITTAVVLEAEGRPFAYGETSFMRMPRAGEVPPLGMPDVIPRHPLARSLGEEAGIELVDASRGHVEVELRPALCNPEGVMQGALVALLAETSAQALAEHSRPGAQIVTELDLRYLATAKVGPIEARAEWVGDADEGMVRVRLVDRGNGGRITTAGLLRTASALRPETRRLR